MGTAGVKDMIAGYRKGKKREKRERRETMKYGKAWTDIVKDVRLRSRKGEKREKREAVREATPPSQTLGKSKVF